MVVTQKGPHNHNTSVMSGILLKKLPLLIEQSFFSGTGFLINIALVKTLNLEQYGLFASLIIFSHLLLSVAQAVIIQPMQVHISKTKDAFSYRFILLLLQLSLIIVFCFLVTSIRLFDFKSLDIGQPFLLPFTLYLTTFLLFDFYRKFFLATGRVTMALIIGVLYSASTISGVKPLFVKVSHRCIYTC